jgi:glycosyltransferase involved in cell wall biosynthesis
VERHVLETSTRIAASGQEVVVLCADPGATGAEVIRDGVSIRSVRAWPAGRDWLLAPGIWGEIKSGTWDIVHVQSYHTFVAPLGMMRALVLNVPYCVTFHGGGHSSSLRRRLRPVQYLALRPLLARAARLIAVARFEIDLYSRALHLPRDRFVHIPNGTDPGEARAVPAASADGSVIATIGRLERYKGHHRVIEALPYLIRNRPDAELLVVGEGLYRDELTRRAAALGVADRVRFTSVPAGDRVAMSSLLERVDVVVLMSEFETHPLVGLEAAAAQKRVLVADRAGLHELVADGLARGVTPDCDPADLAAEILVELAKPPPADVPKLTSWDECATRLLALYREIAGLAGSPGPGGLQ